MQRRDISGKGFRPKSAPETGAESTGKLELDSPGRKDKGYAERSSLPRPLKNTRQAPDTAGCFHQLVHLDRGPVPGQDDLSSPSRKAVQDLEEDSLLLRLPVQELDIIQQEHVEARVPAPKPILSVLFQGTPELPQEHLYGLVENLLVGMDFADLVGNGAQEMGLSQSRHGVDE